MQNSADQAAAVERLAKLTFQIKHLSSELGKREKKNKVMARQ